MQTLPNYGKHLETAMNVCIPSNSYAETPDPNVMVSGDKA
jgi:hypothetical protein